MGPPDGSPKNIFIKVKQDSFVSILLRKILSRTTLLKSFLRNSGIDSLNKRMTCNQLLVKISIFILIIVSPRQRDKPVAHEVKNQHLGDRAAHILGVVMEVLLEDLPTLFQFIFQQGPECVRPLFVDPLPLQHLLTLMEVKQI